MPSGVWVRLPPQVPHKENKMEKPKWPDGPELIEESDTGTKSILKRFLKWIEEAAKKQPPSCGGGCCK